MELKDLMGKHVLQGIELGIETFTPSYFGPEQRNYILFRLDNVTYKATEDPDDGYRSYCKGLEMVDKIPEIKLPDIEVLCNMDLGTLAEYNEILEFIDVKSAECILRIGTGNTNDYYPYCVLEYTPENMHCNKGVSDERNNI